MRSLQRFAVATQQQTKRMFRRRPLKPLKFPTSGFPIIEHPLLLEEEQLPEYSTDRYCAVDIGEVFASKYQVVGKLGFGSTSTVWLAHDLVTRGHVVLKAYSRDRGSRGEFDILTTVNSGNRAHRGWQRVRTVLDSFEIRKQDISHHCLVQQPMWESVTQLLRRNPAGRLTVVLLKCILINLFMALDYLHTECKQVHTDIKADNILLQLLDEELFRAFTRAELTTPSARKFTPHGTIYASQQFGLPRDFGLPVLSDFGEIVRGDEKRNQCAQPDIYRSPEIMLQAEWSYPVDIWNVGAMIWDIFLDRHLFRGRDPQHGEYRTRAHLAEIIAVLGPPPLDLLQRGQQSDEFFAKDGTWTADVAIPKSKTLEDHVDFLSEADRRGFANLVSGMLQWRPEDRRSAKELSEDDWLNSETRDEHFHH